MARPRTPARSDSFARKCASCSILSQSTGVQSCSSIPERQQRAAAICNVSLPGTRSVQTSMGAAFLFVRPQVIREGPYHLLQPVAGWDGELASDSYINLLRMVRTRRYALIVALKLCAASQPVLCFRAFRGLSPPPTALPRPDGRGCLRQWMAPLLNIQPLYRQQ
jgi:hypothetical protein